MKNYRRIRWYLLAPVVAVTTLGLVGAVRPAQSATCSLPGADWVAARKGHLPVSLSEYAKIPSEYRRATYAALPAATRAKLWHEHFALYMLPASGLTPAQRAFLARIDGRTDSLLIFMDRKRSKQEAMADATEAGSLFGERTAEIFYRLVPKSDAGDESEPGVGAMYICDCSLEDSTDYDCYPAECANNICTPEIELCGFQQNLTCDGLCF
jgi:hypothetical protein